MEIVCIESPYPSQLNSPNRFSILITILRLSYPVKTTHDARGVCGHPRVELVPAPKLKPVPGRPTDKCDPRARTPTEILINI